MSSRFNCNETRVDDVKQAAGPRVAESLKHVFTGEL